MPAASGVMVGDIVVRRQEAEINPIGSDARSRWMRENNLVERDRQYWKNVLLSDGRVAQVVENVPEYILRSEQEGSKRVGEQMYRIMEGQTEPLLRKVALNPNIYHYYAR